MRSARLSKQQTPLEPWMTPKRLHEQRIGIRDTSIGFSACESIDAAASTEMLVRQYLRHLHGDGVHFGRTRDRLSAAAKYALEDFRRMEIRNLD